MNRCHDIDECCECCPECSITYKFLAIDNEICALLTNTWRAAVHLQDGFKEELRRKLALLKEEDQKFFDDYIMYFLNEHPLKDYEELSKYDN